MELYLFRHGVAEDIAAGGLDSARRLTREGRDKTAAVAATVCKAGAQPTLILSSPYARALQTAAVAAKEFGYQKEIVQIESLVPHSSPEAVWQDIRDYLDEPAILLTGHEPLLSALAAFLLNAPSLRVEMKKSAMIRIDVETVRAHPHGVLRWMIVPRLAH